jgi:hypothetical protein
VTRTTERNRVVGHEQSAGTYSGTATLLGSRPSFLTGLLSLAMNYRRSHRKVGAFVFPPVPVHGRTTLLSTSGAVTVAVSNIDKPTILGGTKSLKTGIIAYRVSDTEIIAIRVFLQSGELCLEQ